MNYIDVTGSSGDPRPLPAPLQRVAFLLALCLWASAAICTPACALSQGDYLNTGICDRVAVGTLSDCYHSHSVFYDPMNGGSLWSEIAYTILDWLHGKPKAAAPETSPASGPTVRPTYGSYPANHDNPIGRNGSEPRPRDGSLATSHRSAARSGTPQASLSPAPPQCAAPPPPPGSTPQLGLAGAIHPVGLSFPRIDGGGYQFARNGDSYDGWAGATMPSFSSPVTAGLLGGVGVSWRGPQSDGVDAWGMQPGGAGGIGGIGNSGGSASAGGSYPNGLLQSPLTTWTQVPPGAHTRPFEPVVTAPVLTPPAATEPTTGGTTGGNPADGSTGGASPIAGTPIGGIPAGGSAAGSGAISSDPVASSPAGGSSTGGSTSASSPVVNTPASGSSASAEDGIVKPMAAPTTIFHETFNEGTQTSAYVPTGWQEKSYGSSGYAYSGTGGVTNGYAQLTSAGTNSATSLFYTGSAFDATRPWTMTANVYIGGGTGADGITFTWIDAKTLPALSNLAPDSTQGGGMMGLYSAGTAYKKSGFAFELDTYYNSGAPQNDPSYTGTQYQYTDLVAINDTGSTATTSWTHEAGTAHNFSGAAGTFPDSSAWDAVELAYLGNGQFTFYWSTGTGTLNNNYSFTVANYTPSNKDYFGFTGSTGSLTDIQRIDNLQLTGYTPEPRATAIVLCGLVFIVGPKLRRYRRARAAR